jgi:hypothetical protein
MQDGDIVVLIPGILGSVLRKGDRDVWALSAGALARALGSFGRSLTDLTLREDPLDVDDLDGVTAPRLLQGVHLLPGLWKIDGYSQIAAFLKERLRLDGESYFEFAYDWRRDNRVSARKLQRRAQAWLGARRVKFPKAKLVLVGHSMGGLVARHFLEVLDGWSDTRLFVTLGAPFRGSINALDVVANGMQVPLGRIPLDDLSSMARSFTSLYQLLPTYACIEGTGAPAHLRDLPEGVPNVDRERFLAAEAFHVGMNAGALASTKAAVDGRLERYRMRPIVGIRQQTSLSARVTTGGVEVSPVLAGTDWEGDGTVPRFSAVPDELRHDSIEIFASERHSSLQNAPDVLVQLEGILSGLELGANIDRLRGANHALAPRAAPWTLDLQVPDALAVGKPLAIRARLRAPLSDPREPDPDSVDLFAYVSNLDVLSTITVPLTVGADGWHRGEAVLEVAGAFRVTVQGGAAVTAVSDVLLAYDAAASPALPGPQPVPDAVPLRWSTVARVFEAMQPFQDVRAAIEDLAPEESVVIRSEIAPYGVRHYGVRVGEIRARDPIGPTSANLHDVLGLHEYEPSTSVILDGPDAQTSVPVVASPFVDPHAPWRGRLVTVGQDGPAAVGEPTRARVDQLRGRAFRGTPMGLEVSAPPIDAVGKVVRHPSITIRGKPAPSERILVDVDLGLQADAETTAAPLTISVAETWAEIAVPVRIIPPPELVVAPEDELRAILVRRDRRSIPCTFPCTVSANAMIGGTIVVTVSFECADRFSGSAQKSFDIVAPVGSNPGRPAAPPPPDAAAPPTRPPEVTLDSAAPAPRLTVEIFRPDANNPGYLHWVVRPTANVPGLPLRLVGTSALVNPETYARGLAEQGAPRRSGFLSYFQNVVGRQIYQAAPQCFRDAYKALRAAYPDGFDIQFVSDDPYIPWELMWPDDIAGAQALCLDHPVGRWLLDYQTAMPNRLPLGPILTVAPDYAHTGWTPLPKAQEESLLLQRHHGAKPLVPAERKSFIDLLSQVPTSPMSMLHFGGHGSFDGGPGAVSIYLQDDRVYASEVETPMTRLAETGRTLVFFNACEVAAGTQVLGVSAGWAKAFLARRFGAFIAPLWPVYDDHALRMLHEIVSGAIEEKKPIGRVIRDVRRRHFRESPTYLAYLYIGDVLARFG